MNRRRFVAGSGALLAPSSVRAQAQKSGVALVIGNAKYQWESSLPNVRRDVADVAKRLSELGLNTELIQDCSDSALKAAVEQFKRKADGAKFAVFYYAGHGASWDKDTYLVPVNTDLNSPAVVKLLLPVTAISEMLSGAEHRLLVFDNCRNNPADGWRQREALITAGVNKYSTLAQGPNTLALFSTAPGRVAVDGPAGENSPFAAMFLRQLAGATIDLQTLPTQLRRDLLIYTEGRQLLWDHNSYERPFVLSNRSGRTGAASPLQPGPALQIVELDKAYAFAREKGLDLPPGLVALRPAGNTVQSEKVGSYASQIKVLIGTLWAFGQWSIEPFLLIVLAVPNTGTAEIVFATKDWGRFVDSSDGKIWRYSAATVSERSLEFNFMRAAGNIESPQHFRWKDANSGRFESMAAVIAPQYRLSSTFVRLDG